jgi:murein DD-endopeptidase MepM/ murein hydrolase activator NlpD
VSVDRIKQVNGLTSNTIVVGQDLWIPASTGHSATPSVAVAPAPSGALRWPVPTSRQSRYDGDTLTVYAPEGTAVVAAGPGRVSYVAPQVRGQGVAVMLDHYNGLMTYYGRLSRSQVKQGQQVKQGDVLGPIGSGGATAGPRLTFMVFENGRSVPASGRVVP